MLYYHVYIDRDGDDTEETDLSKEQLMKNIVKPYNQRKKFICKGVIVDPSEITTIRIIETEQHSSKLLPQIEAKKGMLAAFGSDVLLLEESGRDVTRQFIKVRTGRRRKKTLRKKTPAPASKNVFIVHGRNHKPMQELKTMLERFGLNPIVLHEKASGGLTLVEKLEKYSRDLGFAFVILTPDDIGALAEDVLGTSMNKVTESTRPLTQVIEELFITARNKQMRFKLLELFSQFFTNRARQNVVLEFGYFIGRLGRDRVCCLYKGDIELPSDMQGIVYIPFKASVNECRDKIIKELKAAGYEIKL